MYGWIAAHRIKPGTKEDFIKTWDRHIASSVLPKAEEGGPVMYSLRPTDDPNEVWTLVLFRSQDAMRQFRESHDYFEGRQLLESYLEELVWEKFIEATPPVQEEQPLHYAVFIQTMPHHLYHLAVIVPGAHQAIEQADILMEQARDSGCKQPHWTMRVYPTMGEIPEILPANSWHMPEEQVSHIRESTQAPRAG